MVPVAASSVSPEHIVGAGWDRARGMESKVCMYGGYQTLHHGVGGDEQLKARSPKPTVLQERDSEPVWVMQGQGGSGDIRGGLTVAARVARVRHLADDLVQAGHAEAFGDRDAAAKGTGIRSRGFEISQVRRERS